MEESVLVAKLSTVKNFRAYELNWKVEIGGEIDARKRHGAIKSAPIFWTITWISCINAEWK